jgi:hypothetical protein
VVRCGIKEWIPKEKKCLIEIGLGNQNMETILDSIVNTIEGRCMTTP